jgi:hypothetical protein
LGLQVIGHLVEEPRVLHHKVVDGLDVGQSELVLQGAGYELHVLKPAAPRRMRAHFVSQQRIQQLHAVQAYVLLELGRTARATSYFC